MNISEKMMHELNLLLLYAKNIFFCFVLLIHSSGLYDLHAEIENKFVIQLMNSKI